MQDIYVSPVGELLLESDGQHLTGLYFLEEGHGILPDNEKAEVFSLCKAQLDAYFAGRLKVFTLPLRLEGTPFRQKVWQALQHIPYGATQSYKDVALAIDQPLAMRAVGGANHHNPVSIIVPCHRVVGADGSLTGYGGGMWRKEWLLNHEKAQL